MSSEWWAGIVGVAVGAVIQVAADWFKLYWADRRNGKVDDIRKTLLVKHLRDKSHGGWVRIETLAQMVGAPLEHTRGLLIECEARGSLKTEKETWALLERHPLKVDEQG